MVGAPAASSGQLSQEQQELECSMARARGVPCYGHAVVLRGRRQMVQSGHLQEAAGCEAFECNDHSPPVSQAHTAEAVQPILKTSDHRNRWTVAAKVAAAHRWNRWHAR